MERSKMEREHGPKKRMSRSLEGERPGRLALAGLSLLLAAWLSACGAGAPESRAGAEGGAGRNGVEDIGIENEAGSEPGAAGHVPDDAADYVPDSAADHVPDDEADHMPDGAADDRTEVSAAGLHEVRAEHGGPEGPPGPEERPYDGIYPQHEPYGTGVGVMPGRVVWAYDPGSVGWDGSGYWWEPGHFDEAAIRRMVDTGIASLGGKENAREGWEALFAYSQKRQGGSGGYVPGQKIAIKTNINGSGVMDDDTSGETEMSYTNPVLLKALLSSLVEEAGVPPSDITVYDVSRLFPDYMVKLCTDGSLEGVSFVGRDKGVADEAAPICWSHPFEGRTCYLPTCVTEADYLINLANLKGHSYGITLCGKNHFGSFINGNAMRPPEGANLHQWLTKGEMGIYSPLVDLMAHRDLGGKTVLYMLDAILCATSEGAALTAERAKWEQEPFNGGYTASLFFSQDPVAIDSVGADLLSNEPVVSRYNGTVRAAGNENYLHEAGLVGSAPSGTVYTDGKGEPVTNLGVHEHWDNAVEKRYSRDRGEDEGIELIRLWTGE